MIEVRRAGVVIVEFLDLKWEWEWEWEWWWCLSFARGVEGLVDGRTMLSYVDL